MNKRPMHGLGLTLVFSAVVFSIFLVTSLIMAAIGLLVIRSGLLEKVGISKPFLLTLLFASVIVGTVVSLMFGHVPLKPIREIINAINQLANGDFSARLTMGHAPAFRELRDSFNRMAQELGSIEMLRSDFINNFSHEFKTPIVSIKGFAELLKMGGLTEQEREEYLDIIIRESARLASMSTNVLNLSKVENQTILTDIKNYDLGEQIRRSILLLQSAWEKKNIAFDIEVDDIFIQANEELLSQVWLNLLDNAIKFSPNGGKIAILLKESEQYVEFTLRDSGCGIEKEDLRHIYDKFFQSDTPFAKSGNGLGLALAHKIVELHKGNILCTSELNRGTEFIVQLPRTISNRQSG